MSALTRRSLTDADAGTEEELFPVEERLSYFRQRSAMHDLPKAGYFWRASEASSTVRIPLEGERTTESQTLEPPSIIAILPSYEKQIHELRELAELNRALLAEIQEIKKLVEDIISKRPRTVVLRAVPRTQAKEEILELFKSARNPLYYSDVAEQLSFDLELVVELCHELETAGQIGVTEPR